MEKVYRIMKVKKKEFVYKKDSKGKLVSAVKLLKSKDRGSASVISKERGGKV